MWKSGIATRLTVLSSNFHISLAKGMRAKKFELVSITPFGRPVVPLEYNWNATSPSALGTFGSVAAPESMKESYDWNLECPPMTTMVLALVRLSAIASRMGTKSGPTMNTLASALLTMYSTSGAASRKLTSTLTAFSSAAP